MAGNDEKKGALPKGFLLESLARWSYFPSQKRECEYIPALHSTKFTPDVVMELSEVRFNDEQKNYKFDQLDFRLTRHNSSTRPLSIPHPLPYAKLCVELDRNLENITNSVNIFDNKNSMIRPGFNDSGKLVVMDYEDPVEKAEGLIEHGFGKRFRVTTDITNCFPSIYTHALPWALVGKDVAKRHQRDHGAWFNKIDSAYRGIKRGETQGLGIGPAVSNFGSEMVLARIDEALREKYEYIRHIDDYTCWCETHEQAVDFIHDLDTMLRSYQLTLNNRKTVITELPAPINSEWIIELQSLSPLSFLNKHDGEVLVFQHSALDAIKFLERALILNSKNSDGSIIKFAARTIVNSLNEFAREPVAHYLINLSFIYPHLLPLLEGLLDSPEVSEDKYARHLNLIARENCLRGRSDGICWPLYYLHKYKLNVDDETVRMVLESKDCTALLLLEHFPRLHGCTLPFVTSLSAGYDADKYWLLVYQLLKWQRLDQRFISPEYEVMMKHDVSFSYLDAEKSKSEVDFESRKIRDAFGDFFKVIDFAGGGK